MFWSLVSLLVLAKVLEGIWWCIKTFWIWSGRGKKMYPTNGEEQLSPEAQEVAEALDAVEAARHVGKFEQGPVVHLTWSQALEVRRAERYVRDDFLDHLSLGWYQCIMVFFLGSVLGLVLEEVWMLITAGLTESRVGLVWGPFSPLYGAGAVLLTVVTFYMRKQGAKAWQVFLISVVVGGLLEQGTGWAMETFMHAVSWDYIAGGVPGAITKWVALPFLFFWGLLGFAWYKFIMPELLFALGTDTAVRRYVFVALLSVYLVSDIGMTLVCFRRRAERDAGIAPQNAFEQWVDERYSDQFISQRFQNMVIEGGSGEEPQ